MRFGDFQCIHVYDHAEAPAHIPKDALWALCYGNDRSVYIRVTTGQKGLDALHSRYAFRANNICVHACTTVASAKMQNYSDSLWRQGVSVIPQVSKFSGRCWWTSLFACLSCPQLIRGHVIRILDERHPEIAAEFRQVETAGRYGNERLTKASETLRLRFFREFSVGHGPCVALKNEGGDAAIAAQVLMTKLGLRVAVCDAVNGREVGPLKKGDHNAHVVFVNVDPGYRWLPSSSLFLCNDGQVLRGGGMGEMKVQAVLLGNVDIGHQICVCLKDVGRFQDWLIADSDASRDVSYPPLCLRVRCEC
eukprot:6214832-Pleurochrysis_carterae.AAC.1